MVAHTVTADHPVILLCALQRHVYILHCGIVEPCGVLRRQTDGVHAAAVLALPRKYRGVEARAHEHIVIHAALFEDLGQVGVVPEAVHVRTDLRDPAELPL